MKDYYITKGSRIRRKGGTVYVEGDAGGRSVPINDIRSIHLLGEMNFNTKFVLFLAKSGIPLHFYNYYGNYAGTFYPRESSVSGSLLVKQVEHHTNTQKRMDIARELVLGAVHGILSNLGHFERRGKPVGEFAADIKSVSGEIAGCASPTQLMGVEGIIRDRYYRSFDSFLPGDFRFERRSRQPPRNRLNCMISFGNSLLYATCLNQVYRTQLNPTISYLHEPGQSRFSLCLDISEVFKPVVVDRVIFRLINKKIIEPHHFNESAGGVYLNERGRLLFLQQHERRLETRLKHVRLKRSVSYRTLISLECYKLVRHLLGKARYRALRV